MSIIYSRLPRLGMYKNVLKCSTAKTVTNASTKSISTDFGILQSTSIAFFSIRLLVFELCNHFQEYLKVIRVFRKGFSGYIIDILTVHFLMTFCTIFVVGISCIYTNLSKAIFVVNL